MLPKSIAFPRRLCRYRAAGSESLGGRREEGTGSIHETLGTGISGRDVFNGLSNDFSTSTTIAGISIKMTMSLTPENRYEYHKKSVERYLRNHVAIAHPRSLYLPCKYILSAGGKRIRPVLALLACEAFGGTMEEALPQALQ